MLQCNNNTQDVLKLQQDVLKIEREISTTHRGLAFIYGRKNLTKKMGTDTT